MIGIIGSADSVARLLDVAAQIGISRVVGRPYRRLEEASTLAVELDPVCSVLLFTGYVPFHLTATTMPTLRGRLLYVPHAGIDLYRTLALVLRDRGGDLPRLSLDTIQRSVAEETFMDLGFPIPKHVFSLDDEATSAHTAEDLVAFHAARFRDRSVDCCLTCLGEVAERLAEQRVTVVRVEHTRSALRDALAQAELTAEVARIEDAQAAVAVLTSGNAAPRVRRLRQAAVRLAEQLHGAVAESDERTWLVHTTRGAVERTLARHEWRWWNLAGSLDVAPGTRFGFGVGLTAADAEGNARRAVQLDQSGERLTVVLADGSVVERSGLGPEAFTTLRQTDERLLAHARHLGLSRVTLLRVAGAMRHLDPDAFTARELADAYGVEPRSARRLLGTLQQAGIVDPAGVQSPPRAGRPQTVFRIDVSRLLGPADSSG